MKKLRVLVLVHADLVPPLALDGLSESEIADIRTEYDVTNALRTLGHDCSVLGLLDELAPLRHAFDEWKPDIVFNLLEEFRGQAVFDANVVSYLELIRAPYTGCNPRGLVVTRDKALSKKILHYHRIRVPQFMVVPIGRKARRHRRLGFPLIVKSLIEEASVGIAQASVVSSDDKLVERVRFIHEHVRTDAIVEQYIPGRDVYCAVMGNHRVTTFPLWELRMDRLPDDAHPIATRKVKWDLEYQKKYSVELGPARDIADALVDHIQTTSRRIYRLLGMSGYGRLDFRLADDGAVYFLEANPNCDIGEAEEFASAAALAGYPYRKLVQRVLGIGISRHSAP